MRRSLGATVGLVLTAASLGAQSAPGLAVDLLGGKGPHSDANGGLYYYKNEVAMGRAGLAVALWRDGRLGGYVTADWSIDASGDKVAAACFPTPSGSCRGQFPRTQGLASGVAARIAITDRLHAAIGVGIARYSGSARYVDADVTIKLFSRAGIKAHLRHVQMDASGGRVWFRPLMFGIELF